MPISGRSENVIMERIAMRDIAIQTARILFCDLDILLKLIETRGNS